MWWLPALVLFILAMAAIVDAYSSTVPDSLIYLGLIAVLVTQGIYISWDFAKWHAVTAIAAALFIWIVNHLWRIIFKVDALGMGDAKWSALAVSCFDLAPVMVAWGIGAWCGLIWMGVARLAHYQITRVYFAPFLFIGLVFGLWWLRLRGIM